MEWLTLIPTALSFLSTIFGPQSTTTTTSPQNSPALEAAANKLFTEAGKVFERPYQRYTGDRTANPTVSRANIDPVMDAISQQTMGGLNDANGYKARVSALMGRGPSRVAVPPMVPGGAQVGGPY